MSEDETQHEIDRANLARERLTQDWDKLEKAGNAMLQKGTRAIKHGLPVVALALGAVSLALVGAAWWFKTRSRTTTFQRGRPERSLAAEALRTATLSAVSVLTARLVAELPLPFVRPPT